MCGHFSDRDNIDFIIVSFDYKYDTPRILNEYYGPIISGHKNWYVWSSTGQVSDVYRLTKQVGCEFWGVDENDIGHTLRSVLLDPERRLMKAFDGTDWRPEVVERDIRNIFRAYNF